jgi:hypothetical protein
MKLFLGRLNTTHDVLRDPFKTKILPHALQPYTLSGFNWHGLSTILFTQVSSSQIYNLTNKSINWKLKVWPSGLRPPCRPPLHPHLPESGRALGGVSAAEAGVVPAEAPGQGRGSQHGARCRAQRLGHAPWSRRRSSSPSQTSTCYSIRSPHVQPLSHAMYTLWMLLRWPSLQRGRPRRCFPQALAFVPARGATVHLWPLRSASCRGTVSVQFSYSQMARKRLKWRARLVQNGQMPLRDFYLGSWLTRSDGPYWTSKYTHLVLLGV